MRLLIVLLLTVPAVLAYDPLVSDSGAPLRRTDAANLQLLVNQSIAPGLQNAQGQTSITGDSNPLTALQAAAVTWSNLPTSTVNILPLQSTAALNDPQDLKNVIVFADTPENRSAVGSALAITLTSYDADTGAILDSDILFSPAVTFSTTLAPNTYDLQSVATHEFGHALGANHSGVLAATMFQAMPMQDRSQSRLSPDDLAFVSDAYPSPAAADAFSVISGTVMQLAGGNSQPMRGGLVIATDPVAGVTVGGLSSLTDGTYSFKAPRGNYLVYAAPLDGPVYAANLSLGDSQIDQFGANFFGGAALPQMLDITSGEGSADIMVSAVQAGFQLEVIGTGQTGASGDVLIGSGPIALTPGQSLDLVLWGPGIDAGSAADVRLLAPGLTVRANSMRVDNHLTINGGHPLRLTVDVAPASTMSIGDLIVLKNGAVATLSGDW